MFDYGYIVDANSRERIWEMEEYETEYAGGALKNRMIRDEIELEPGNYIVYYKSDEGHSYDNWNAN